MAARYAVANGNWSSVSTWDGTTTLPSPGDTVRPNGFTVTIDQDVTVAELRNEASGSAANGGGFQITTVGAGVTRTVTAALRSTATTAVALLNITATAGTVNLVGDIYGATGAQSATAVVVNPASGALTVNVTGDIIGPNTAGSTQFYTFAYSSSFATLTITGDVVGGGPLGSVHMALNSASAVGAKTVTINGDVYGGSSNSSYAIFVSSASTAYVINGSVHGSAVAHALNTAGGNVTVSGDVDAVGGNLMNGIRAGSGSGTVIVGGDVIADGSSPAIDLGTSTGNVDLQGAVTATTDAAAVVTAGLVRARGPLTDGSNGRRAVLAPRIFLYASPTDTDWSVRDSTGWPSSGAVQVLTNIGNGMPDPADVVEGVVYGTASEHTGTMKTAAITAADVWDVDVGSLITAGSIGAYLSNAATAASVAALVAAALDAA